MLPNFKDLDPETVTLIKAALPRVGKELVDVIGLAAFLNVVDAFGGKEVWLPRLSTSQSRVLYTRWIEAVGHDNYQALLFNYPERERIAVPFCARAKWALRNREIVKEYEELIKTTSCRKAVDTLVDRWHVTSRTVEKVVNGKQGNGRTCQFEKSI